MWGAWGGGNLIYFVQFSFDRNDLMPSACVPLFVHSCIDVGTNHREILDLNRLWLGFCWYVLGGMGHLPVLLLRVLVGCKLGLCELT